MSRHGHIEAGGSAAGGAHPLLIECDRHGQVLWLSDEARAAFGEPRNLVDAIPTGRPRSDSAVCLARIFEGSESVLMTAQFGHLMEHTAQEEAAGLADLQENMLRHCFRLQHVERVLFTRARRKRRAGGGGQALMQVERERQRLGRELHTGVGQMLAAVRMQLEIIDSQFPDPPSSVQQALKRISTLASGALEQVRSISHRIHPPDWQALTLENALRQLWETSGVPERYEASLRIDPLPAEPDLELKVLIYRTAQESLSNLARHSRATRVQMTLTGGGGRVTLQVADNGVGFDVSRLLSATSGAAAGIGLRSLREQAASVGGRLAIESSSAGTRLEVSAPFDGTTDKIPS